VVQAFSIFLKVLKQIKNTVLKLIFFKKKFMHDANIIMSLVFAIIMPYQLNLLMNRNAHGIWNE
jgi:hypothetical protein